MMMRRRRRGRGWKEAKKATEGTLVSGEWKGSGDFQGAKILWGIRVNGKIDEYWPLNGFTN